MPRYGVAPPAFPHPKALFPPNTRVLDEVCTALAECSHGRSRMLNAAICDEKTIMVRLLLELGAYCFKVASLHISHSIPLVRLQFAAEQSSRS